MLWTSVTRLTRKSSSPLKDIARSPKKPKAPKKALAVSSAPIESTHWYYRLLITSRVEEALVKFAMPLETPSTSSKANSVENPTVPPAYVCYILRSKQDGKYNNRTYVGSTPDPPRRFRQHNRDIKGGAFKTRMHAPWEMEAICCGFPNKLSALQFEWAWDKAERTHWLVAPALQGEEPPAPSSSPSKKAQKSKGKKKTLALTDGDGTLDSEPMPDKGKGKAKAKAAVIRLFPKGAAAGESRTVQRFAALQRLLTTPPFTNFNLSVYLFSADAEKWWNAALLGKFPGGWADKKSKVGSARFLATQAANRIGPVNLSRIAVIVRHSGIDGKRKEREKGVRYGSEKEEGEGILDVTDRMFEEDQWSKWQDIETPVCASCACCADAIGSEAHLEIALCPAPGCSALSHLGCLALHFLADQPSTSKKAILPVNGACPSCHNELHWQDVIRSCWRRHEKSIAPARPQRGRKKLIASVSEEEQWDSSDVETMPTAGDYNADEAAQEEAEEEADRSFVEGLEEEASFDAGCIWQPEAELTSSPSSTASKRRRRSKSLVVPAQETHIDHIPISAKSFERNDCDTDDSSSDAPVPLPTKRRKRRTSSESDSEVSSSPKVTKRRSSRSLAASIEQDSPTPVVAADIGASATFPGSLNKRMEVIELSSDSSPSTSPAKRGRKKATAVIDLSE